MKVHNRAGQLVELPTSVSRDQLDAALYVLGVPRHVGAHSVLIGVRSILVRLHELDEDGQNTGGRITVELPYGTPPDSAGGAA